MSSDHLSSKDGRVKYHHKTKLTVLSLGNRLKEFYEFNMKPAWNLLCQGEFGFLCGTVGEKVIGWNPYFSYRDWRGKNRYVTRQIRDHKMRIDLYDRGLSRHLFIRGNHEENARKAYRDAITEIHDDINGGITVLDIGGNIGYYVLEEASILDDRDSIIVFEPDPMNRKLLKYNVKLNGYENLVDISPNAVDETSGVRTFYRSTHSNWNRLEQDTKTKINDEVTQRFSVETISVDKFLETNRLSPEVVNVVRMDLEGHEPYVLRGMTEVLSANGPLVLFVEFHPDFKEGSVYEEALSALEKYEFSIRFVDQNLNTLNIESFEELRSVRGSHVRVILSK